MKKSGLSHTLSNTIYLVLVSLFLMLFQCRPGEKGPGGPILVIDDISPNKNGPYITEILRAEGLNAFDVAGIEDIDPRILTKYTVLILNRVTLSVSQVRLLSNWVNAGGLLITFRPDQVLYGLCGIKSASSEVLKDKYILVKNSGPGVGIVNETLQYHGEADLYSLTRATAIASLYTDANIASPYPAVTSNRLGSGTIVTFAYDLGQSVIYTRQGNPLWAGQERDGAIGPIRSNDLFYPDWIDFNKIAIPQADEQQRFLSNIILKGNSGSDLPLPKFWYLPKGLKAAIVMTGDDHGGNGTIARFKTYLENGPNSDSDVVNWNAVRATSYVYPENIITNEQAMAYEKQGFELALHLTTNCGNWTPKLLDDELVDQLGRFKEKYHDIHSPETNRTHCLVWSDWSSQAKILSQHDIKLDVTYYYWPGEWVKNRPGFFTGSGIPMRYADTDETVVDCYQAVTQLTDESDINYRMFIDQLLDKAIGKEGYYGVFVTNMHTDHAKHSGSDIVVEAALKRKIPVVSARQLLTWLQGRSQSSFGSISWNNRELTFYILAAPGSTNMKAMLPVYTGNRKLNSILKNEKRIPFTTEVIKGIEYAFFDGLTGNYTAIYENDNHAPQISDIQVKAEQDGATVTWTTDELADSKVHIEPSDGSSLLAENPSPATNHRVRLSSLQAGATYNLLISSEDKAGNVTAVKYNRDKKLTLVIPSAPCIVSNRFENASTTSLLTDASITETTAYGISIKPEYYESFSGTAVPGYMNLNNSTSGIVVDSGFLKVDGNYMTTTNYFQAGSTLEFDAAFSGENGQNIGYIKNGLFDSSSISVGTNQSRKGIFAKGLGNEILILPFSEFSKTHRFRIEWKASRVLFFVDGIEAATVEHISKSKRQLSVRDSIRSDSSVKINWIQMSPFTATKGGFTSEVYDGNVIKEWDFVSWEADVPEKTSVKVFLRYGNTRKPDKSWTPFIQATNATNVSRRSRYIQYYVELSSEDLNVSPVFRKIMISCKP